jgi:hypothetical protein
MSTFVQFLTMQHGREVLGSCFILCITICIWSFRQIFLGDHRKSHQTKIGQNRVSVKRTQVLRCNVSHHRIFPKHHGFTYPYLSVGIPVRSPTSTWLLSIDESSWWRRGWLHVTTKDHLHRGCNGNTLSENLDAYLEELVGIQKPHKLLQNTEIANRD